VVVAASFLKENDSLALANLLRCRYIKNASRSNAIPMTRMPSINFARQMEHHQSLEATSFEATKPC
jgi:hypothetical protein